MANWITTKQKKRIDLDLYDAVEDYYDGKNLPTYYLNKKEYAVVVSEINRYYKKYKNEYMCSYYSGNASNQSGSSNIYIFENHGFGSYRFIDIIKLSNRNIYKLKKGNKNG